MQTDVKPTGAVSQRAHNTPDSNASQKCFLARFHIISWALVFTGCLAAAFSAGHRVGEISLSNSFHATRLEQVRYCRRDDAIEPPAISSFPLFLAFRSRIALRKCTNGCPTRLSCAAPEWAERACCAIAGRIFATLTFCYFCCSCF